jgi:hypothetical protein
LAVAARARSWRGGSSSERRRGDGAPVWMAWLRCRFPRSGSPWAFRRRTSRPGGAVVGGEVLPDESSTTPFASRGQGFESPQLYPPRTAGQSAELRHGVGLPTRSRATAASGTCPARPVRESLPCGGDRRSAAAGELCCGGPVASFLVLRAGSIAGGVWCCPRVVVQEARQDAGELVAFGLGQWREQVVLDGGE